MDVGRQC